MVEFYKLPIRERWDTVLKWFAVIKTHPFGSTVEVANFINLIAGNQYTSMMPNLVIDLQPIVDKLITEGKLQSAGVEIFENREFLVYKISEDGRIFFEDGGYVAEFRKLSAKNDLSESVSNSVIANGKLTEKLLFANKAIALGTVVAAVATSCLVLIELIKKLGWVLSINFLTTGFLYLLGVCTGLLTILIADKVLKRKSR